MLLPAGRWGVVVFATLLGLAITILVLSNIHYVSGSHVPTRAVEAVPARMPPPETRDPRFLGVVLPYEAVDVSARLDGHITEIHVATGGHVRRGAILAVVDPDVVTRADLVMAEAELGSAQTETRRLTIELAQARERLARIVSLSEQHLVTGEQLADLRYQEQLAAARLSSAQSLVAQKGALVDQRTTLWSNVHVRAPFDGTIAARYADRGSHVARGAPILRLVRTEPLKLRFAVPIGQAQWLRVGAPLTAAVEDTGIVLTGAVEAVSPEVESSAQMVVAEAVLRPPQVAGKTTPMLTGRTAFVTAADPAVSTREHAGTPF